MLNLLHLQFNILLVFFAFSCSGFSVFPQRGAAAEGPGSPQLRVPAFRSDKLRPLCFWRFNGFWQQLLTLLLFRSRKESTTKHLLEVAGQGAAFQSKLLNETHTWTYPEPPVPSPNRHLKDMPPSTHVQLCSRLHVQQHSVAPPSSCFPAVLHPHICFHQGRQTPVLQDHTGAGSTHRLIISTFFSSTLTTKQQ